MISKAIVSGLMAALLGGYTVILVRLWRGKLVSLAERFDRDERRKRAARWYPLVALCLGGGCVAVLLATVRLIAPASVYFLIPLPLGLVPAIVWWFRRMSSLKDLGYGPSEKQQP